MESGFPNGGSARVRYKLTLDDYVYFFDNAELSNLTVDQLNQIIDIHGFKKLHKVPKTVLCDAVNSLELMNPCRSTLKDDKVSSCAVLTLEEVTKGLNDLGWQECCVTSMQMLNSVDIEADQLNAMACSSNNTSASSSRVKKTRKKKMRRLNDVESNFSSNENRSAADQENPSHSQMNGGLGSASYSANSHGAMKLAPRRGRNLRILHETYTNALLHDTESDRNWSVC